MSFERDWTVAPGETLGDWCEENGLTDPVEAAERFGLDIMSFSRLLTGDLEIDESLAQRIEAVTSIKANFWLTYEQQFRDDLKLGRIHVLTRKDRWIIAFMRLDAAINHHKKADRFKDDHDEALYAARDRIVRSLAEKDDK